jgi:hypothetical protein
MEVNVRRVDHPIDKSLKVLINLISTFSELKGAQLQSLNFEDVLFMKNLKLHRSPY